MRDKICMLAVLVILFCGIGVGTYADEEEHVSDIYDSQEEVPQPEPELVNEAGENLMLLRTEIEMIPVTDRKKNVNSYILYEAVRKEDSIPESALISVFDEETGQNIDKILPLKKKNYYNERWENFEFKVTFHSYGADIYRIGTYEIPKGDPMPDMQAAEPEVLSLIGMNITECRIESYDWSGDEYYDQEGELCRDALAYAVRRVWDCDAIYGGTIELPDRATYRRKSVYDKIPEETQDDQGTEMNSEPEELPEPVEESSESKGREHLLNRLWKYIISHFSVTIGVIALAAFALMFWILRRFAVYLQKRREDEYSNDKHIKKK